MNNLTTDQKSTLEICREAFSNHLQFEWLDEEKGWQPIGIATGFVAAENLIICGYEVRIAPNQSHNPANTPASSIDPETERFLWPHEAKDDRFMEAESLMTWRPDEQDWMEGIWSSDRFGDTLKISHVDSLAFYAKRYDERAREEINCPPMRSRVEVSNPPDAAQSQLSEFREVLEYVEQMDTGQLASDQQCSAVVMAKDVLEKYPNQPTPLEATGDAVIAQIEKLEVAPMTKETRLLLELAKEAQRTGKMPDLSSLNQPASPQGDL